MGLHMGVQVLWHFLFANTDYFVYMLQPISDRQVAVREIGSLRTDPKSSLFGGIPRQFDHRLLPPHFFRVIFCMCLSLSCILDLIYAPANPKVNGPQGMASGILLRTSCILFLEAHSPQTMKPNES